MLTTCSIRRPQPAVPIRLLLLTLACLLGLLIAGCGDDDGSSPAAGSDADSATDAADGGTSGEDAGTGSDYAGVLEDGSELRVRLDVVATDPAVEPFEELRTLGGGDDPTWIVAEITAPADLDATGRFLSFVADGADRLEDDPSDPDDGVSQSDFVCSRIDGWFAAAIEAGADQTEVQDIHQELLDGPCGGQTLQVLAPAGETTTYVMVHDGPIPGFASLQAGLGNELSPP